MNQAKSFSVIDRDVTTSIFSRNPCTHTLILHLEESQNQGKEINERKKPAFLFIMSIMIIPVSIVIMVIIVIIVISIIRSSLNEQKRAESRLNPLRPAGILKSGIFIRFRSMIVIIYSQYVIIITTPS